MDTLFRCLLWEMLGYPSQGQMMVQETILCQENLDMCNCCRSKPNALTSDAMTNWFKDFGPHAVIRGARPELDTEMSSCVGCCGLNKWHLEAPNWWHRGEIIGRMKFVTASVYIHQCGFVVERRDYFRSSGSFLTGQELYMFVDNHVGLFYFTIIKHFLHRS